jgi:ABC-type polar amino acid transport system ATPase subunit
MASFRANFRNQKTLEEFDFSFNPNINRSLILDLASCRFISEKVCAFIIGPCGTGKSHLAQALKSLDFYAINSMGYGLTKKCHDFRMLLGHHMPVNSQFQTEHIFDNHYKYSRQKESLTLLVRRFTI